MKAAASTILALTALLAAGCDRSPRPGSSLDTVHIDQTPVKDQGGVGFCWSYTTMGLIESLALRNGLKLDLSEEYLGFYRVLESLQEALKAENPQAAIAKFTEGYSVDGALALVGTVGLVPESVFSKKFSSTTNFGGDVQRAFAEKFADAQKLAEYRSSPDLLRSELEALFGVRVPRPTDTFTFEGQTYTPVSFARDVTKFRPDDFTTLWVRDGDPQSMEIASHYMKVALMNHVSVPVGMAILPNTQGGVWDSEICKGVGCESRDGHAMLIVDFLTKGGRGGEMPAAEALRVFHEPLEGIIVKNSWGFTTALNQDGNPASGNRAGYNLIHWNYLEESNAQARIDITVPKFVMEETTGVVEAGLRVGIEGPTSMALAGENQTFKAHLLSIDAGSSASAVTLSWELKNSLGQLTASGQGREMSIAPAQPGLYELTLKATQGSKVHSARKSVWVGDGRDFLTFTGAVGTTNFATYSWSSGRSSYAFDTRNGQPVADANQATITLPPVQLDAGGRIEFYLNYKDKTGLNPHLQVSSDNGSTFEELFCFAADPNARESLRLRCPFPAKGAGIPTRKRLQFRIAAEAMPQAQYKANMLQEITELTARVAGGSVVTLSAPAHAVALYPQGASYKNIIPVGTSLDLAGLFPTPVDAVRVYRGGSLLKEIPAQSLTRTTHDGNEALLATIVAQSSMPGSVHYRLVAMVDDVESGALDYEVLAVPQLTFSAASPFVADLRQSIPFAFDSSWFATPLGLSASPFSEGNKMVRKIENMSYGTAGFALDLSRTRNNRLDLQVHHNLEQDFDFVYVRASADNGKTWQTLASRTGTSVQGAPGSQPSWNNVTVDLSAFDGKPVLVRVDAETDQGEKSNWLLIRSIRVSGR